MEVQWLRLTTNFYCYLSNLSAINVLWIPNVGEEFQQKEYCNCLGQKWPIVLAVAITHYLFSYIQNFCLYILASPNIVLWSNHRIIFMVNENIFLQFIKVIVKNVSGLNCIRISCINIWGHIPWSIIKMVHNDIYDLNDILCNQLCMYLMDACGIACDFIMCGIICDLIMCMESHVIGSCIWNQIW